jgi:NAD(P)-dependent dehydrogenase (short-subunit alcohol dehydrogenase family)
MKNKIALVTGGSRGLGKDMALKLAQRGVNVVVTYKSSQAQAQSVVKELEALGVQAAAIALDLSQPNAVTPFVKNFLSLLESRWNTQNFDFLINNAGMGATVPMENVTEDLFDQFLNVHFKGVYFLTQKLLPQMNSGGRVIMISSGTTRFCNPGYSVYASMKGAIEVLTRYIAKEYGPKGIGANVVAPGPIETDFNNAAIRNNPQFKERLAGLTSLGRVGVAEDLGGIVSFLCSEEGRWVNGQRIEASGGINL